MTNNVKRSSNKSQETRKIKKILQEEIRLGINSRSDSETEEVDLKKEIFPLGHYINDREEMIEQMFSIINGEKIRKMLPPILKDIPLDEIKADCLIHLLGMSTKRIMATLEGREIYSSSDSETNSGSSTSPNKKAKLELKPFMIKQEGCSDISDNSEEVVLVEPDADSSRSAKESQKQKKRHRHKKKNSLEKIKKTRTKIHQEKVKKSNHMKTQPYDSSTGSENEVEEDSPKEEKSLLEMLELEMRRRAIRALLDKEVNQENDGKEKPTLSTENVSTIKPGDSSKKITPVRHFRKKKHKNDDVIVIVPKLVTIDLTDDHKQSKVDSKKDVIEQNNVEVEDLINSFQINTYEENNRNSDTSEECSNTSKTKSDVEVEGSKLECIDEVIDIPDSPEENKSPAKAEEEQPNKNETLSDNKEQPNSNWALRWLDSKDVKKVVSTSKICGNIRKKIKSAKLAKKAEENLPKDVVETPEIHGSVVEYQSLPKSSIILNKANETTNENNSEENNKSSQVDEIKENHVVIDLKAPALVFEQVQDVSSTKNDVSVLINTKDQIMSNVQVNETPTSNSNGVLVEKGDDSQEVENIELIPINVQISESNTIDTTNSKRNLLKTDTTPELTNDSEIISNSHVVNTYDGNLKNISNYELDLGMESNLGSKQVQSDLTELNNMATNASSFNEFENSCKIKGSLHYESPDDELDNVESDITLENEPSSSLDLNNKTSKTKIILNLDMPSCSAKKASITESRGDSTKKLSPADLLSAAQEIVNEPDALEIDINEEDREIE